MTPFAGALCALLTILVLPALSQAMDAANMGAGQEGSPLTTQQEDELESFVTQLMECRGVVGLSLAVVKGNQTWTRGFGVADMVTNRSVTPDTLFGIGSLSKFFTASLISLAFNDSDKFSWDSKVADILGDKFEFSDPRLTAEATVADMLVHRTGLLASNIPFFAGMTMSRTDLPRNIKYLPVSAPFRDKWEYNNWMYGLAGRVAEVLEGSDWVKQLRERLTGPAGMANTTVIRQGGASVDDPNFAKPYVRSWGQIEPSDAATYNIGTMEPAGGIASSANDMAAWLVMLNNNGITLDGTRVLGEEALKAMLTPRALVPMEGYLKPEFPGSFATYGYGYGWFVGTYRGYKVQWHTGGLNGYVTMVARIPEEDVAVFVTTSGPGDRNASALLRQVVFRGTDMALGLDPWLTLQQACTFPEGFDNSTAEADKEKEEDARNVTSSIQADVFPRALAATYEGTYSNPLFGVVDVRLLDFGNDTAEARLVGEYGLLKGSLLRTDAAHETLMDVQGAYAFLFRSNPNRTLTDHLNLTFADASTDKRGRFQTLLVSAPALGERVPLAFTRGGVGASTSSAVTLPPVQKPAKDVTLPWQSWP